MADVFENLTANVSPHVRGKDTSAGIMRDVTVSLVPCVFASVWYFGPYALLLMIVSVLSALAGEVLFQKLRHRPMTVGDGSAVVTGLILALNLPATVPVYIPVIGSLFAIVVVKMMFGGLGKNFANPAATARLFLMLAYTTMMTNYVAPGKLFSLGESGLLMGVVDGVTAATPLSGGVASLKDLLFGNVAGAMGETCKLAILVGAVYLFQRRIIAWQIPVGYLVTFAFLTAVTGASGEETLRALLSGGLLFGAVFMATDYATSPKTATGRTVYAVALGVMTYLIRRFSAFNEGVAFSIVLLNLFVPLIDRYLLPRRFGSAKKSVLPVVLYSLLGCMLVATAILVGFGYGEAL